MLKKMCNVFKECFFSAFSIRLSSSSITKGQRKKIEKNLILNNAKTTVPVTIIIIVTQIYFIINDIITGLYSEAYSFLNLGAEIALLAVSSIMFVTLLILFSKKCERVKTYKILLLFYYFVLTAMLSLFVIAKVLRMGEGGIQNIDSSIVYLTLILVVCPLYSRILTYIMYSIMIVAIFVSSSYVNNFTWIPQNILLIFMGILVSTYTCGRNINTRVNDEKLLELNSELSMKLDTDELTQVYNRRALKNYLELKSNEWKDSMAYVTFIMLDIDFFKKYNDTYGHLKGDECLKRVALATNLAVQSFNGNVYRYGGEEFLIIAPDATPDIALQIAKEIHKSISKLKITHEAVESNVLSVSLGVNVENSFKKNSSAWILEADNQLYRAKHEGRNCTSFENKIYKAK